MNDVQRKRRFARDVFGEKTGSVATIFAIAMVPVVIAAGVGIDLSRAMSSRSNLQDALDAASLALAHLSPTTSDEDFRAKANTWLQANLHDSAMGPVTLDFARSKGQVVLTATSTVPTTLTSIAGYRTLDIKAESTVKWGLGHVEVALVLDNTGSMAGTKLTMLKEAASSLVDTLVASNTSSDPNALKLSLVPFSMTVRVDPTYRTSTWMLGGAPDAYRPNGEPDIFSVAGTNRFTMLDNMGVSWKGCLESRPQPYDVQETAPSAGTPGTMFVPYFAPDEPDSKGVLQKISKSGKKTFYSFDNSYLPDEKPDDTDDVNDFDDMMVRQGYVTKYNEAPSNGVNSTNGGPNNGCSMQAIQRLTTSTSTIKTKISNMQATGNTNVPMGLVWGWHTLSPYGPFADGVPYTNQDTKKFIVLLTDGDNTNPTNSNPNNSEYAGLGYAWQQRLGKTVGVNSTESERMAAMDARLKLLCDNIRAAQITVYTVRIDLSGSASTALSGCATTSDKFYDIDSSGLNAAFQNIAGEIARLRIAS